MVDARLSIHHFLFICTVFNRLDILHHHHYLLTCFFPQPLTSKYHSSISVICDIAFIN